MYQRRRPYRRSGGGSMGSYLMPFLILIAVGLILVLIFNLFKSLFGEKDVQAAYMHIVEGSVDMRTWGSDDFINLSSDALILQGDEIVTSADGRVIVEFFDGTIMRLDGGTDVTFEEFEQDEQSAMIGLIMVDGDAWFNKVYKGSGATDLNVKMSNVQVSSEGASVFSLESDLDEVVRVKSGESISVEVMDQDGRKAVDTIEVALAQQAVISDQALDRFWQFQSPNVLSAISEEFNNSEWKQWNDQEDQEPTEFEKNIGGEQFVKVEPEVVEGETDQEVDQEDQSDDQDQDAEEDQNTEDQSESDDQQPAESGQVQTPGIVSVGGVTQTNADGFYVVNSNPALIYGTANGAAQIVVNDFTLQKFSAGDANWNYFANADFGLMAEGENTYQVFGYDATGNRSEPLIVKVLYQPKVEQPAAEETSEDQDGTGEVAN